MSLDSRLVDFSCGDEDRIAENLNRILAIIDALPTGGGVDPDITINAEATYDSSKEEWSVDSLEVTLKDGTDYDDLLEMLTDTSNAPVVAGGIKITTEIDEHEVSITSMPTSFMAVDMGGGDVVCFTLQQPVGLGTIMGILTVEDEEFALALNIIS